jgi:hypothetical protein
VHCACVDARRASDNERFGPGRHKYQIVEVAEAASAVAHRQNRQTCQDCACAQRLKADAQDYRVFQPKCRGARIDQNHNDSLLA